MSFTNSSASNSLLFSQTSINYIQTHFDEELELQELEAEKEIFAQMFQTHYNTTNMFIQTVQESDILKQTKKLRILKRKLRKLMRSQISRRRGMNSQRQGESLSGMTASNQSQYYPYYEGPYYGNSHQETDNSDIKSIPEPIINPDISIISSSSTLHSSSQTKKTDVNNVEVQKIADNNSNIIKNNNNINTTNNQCEGIVKRAFQQYDPNEQCQWFQHQQQ
ncbi:unnamed protein product (macronuclear) [Paramecium tetraurelia]|uniref:Uncharacterized protein n=1 Tax=Paramecium tetraurelia TaxID=5888 RepID=A0EF98_PARTE|nr:uncharacterized protein GSPATT00026312001 [Paramecium tetraurelia]CAK93989.1 unnamed protein product [Paramecium tetraurelia]|eukprot:XP_001461362.1 hypothetical protein (macronuclear) [Paramecium tetraurelia strain d4-2]